MDSGVSPQIFALAFLIILSAFFSSAETAFVSVNQIRMRSLAEDGSKRAKRVLKITADSSRMLSAILIGNNLVNISASSLATTISLALWGNRAVSIATGILTLVVLVFGEISPKTVATAYADRLALMYSKIILGLMYILTPVIFIINKVAKAFLFILGFNPNRHKASITEDELRTIVDVSREEGVIESEEHEMINNVFDLDDTQVKDIMIPRIDMTCISIDSTYEDIINIFREFKYTRLPVFENSADNVIGIINVKDLLLCEDTVKFHVKDILRKPYFTFEFKKISELLDELKKSSNSFAIVVDEYGQTVGMVTLEDLLEEIVGEIRDEYDEDEEDDIVKISDSEYILSGSARLNDLANVFELPDEDEDSEDFDSLGGLIVKYLERLPQTGDVVELTGLKFEVMECDKNRITKVHAFIIDEDNNNEPEE